MNFLGIEIGCQKKAVSALPSHCIFYVYSKVGREYRRLCHAAYLRRATLKKSVLILCHFPIKLRPLITNKILVFRIEHLEASKIAYESLASEVLQLKKKFWEMAQASQAKPAKPG